MGSVMEAVCNQTEQGILICAVCLLYDFQTLITGALAVAIAAVGARSVWRQLKDTNLQTRISHRETLANLLRDALLRFKKVEDALTGPLDAAGRATSSPIGEPLSISPHDAHGLDQKFHGVLDWYLVDLANTEHSDIEAQKSALKEEIDSLSKILQEAHWAAHNEQQDEDHNFSDDQWAAILDRHEKAKVDAFQFVNNAEEAYRLLRESQNDWVRSLREKIAKLDLELSTG
tara:strand:+ start:1657 stop:2349 length:693 start_codon:yes stop_codon:yes gene_type:complete